MEAGSIVDRHHAILGGKRELELAVGQRAINVDLKRSLFFALILAALNGDFITEFAVQTVAERRGQLRVTSADSTFYFNEQLRRRQSCVT